MIFNDENRDIKRRLLIVDDEYVNREILGGILSSQFEVVKAESGEEALALMKQDPDAFSCVLLDLMMPGMSGWDVIDIMKQDPALVDIPVIVLTAQKSAEVRSLKIGAADFIPKPYDAPDVILARVRRVIIISERARMAAAGEMDRLTGLLQRAGFFEKAREKGVVAGYGVAYCNLTNFRQYNALHGTKAGDKCLVEMARALETIFEDCIIARFSDDRFVVYGDLGDIGTRIGVLDKTVADRAHLASVSSVRVKAGVRRISEADFDIPPSVICDQAKAACDELRASDEANFLVYTDALDHDLELRGYIVENLEKAISEGWIKVYYQPVIRTLTGKLCGAEALVRWVDPVHGAISPAMCIPTLERARLINKLDGYIVSCVCRDIRRQINSWGDSIPISINLSRVDFEVDRPFEMVESAAKKYGIPRNYLRVEVTETTIMSDEGMVARAIEEFHNAGYEVWMDDFGSGYSSLNMLRNFHFDEVKLDMGFLRQIDDKGKKVVSAVISMAKGLGIKTLAEGAETQEHVEFLKEIGCEKIQGYYYGKPMKGVAFKQHCLDFGIEDESRAEERMLDEVGKLDFLTDLPLALIKDDGSSLEILHANKAFRESLAAVGTNDLESANANLMSTTFVSGNRFREFADTVSQMNEEASVTFADRGNYIRLTGKMLASSGSVRIHRVSMSVVERDGGESWAVHLDETLRQLLPMYNNLYLLDPKTNTEEVISSTRDFEQEGDVYENASTRFAEFARRAVYLEDRERFLEFTEYDKLLANIQRVGKGHYSECFRLLANDGNYEWREFTVIATGPERDAKVLVAVKDATIEYVEDPKDVIALLGQSVGAAYRDDKVDPFSHDGILWRNLMHRTRIKYFWKDTERRFVGASDSFLEYYGFDSLDDILGKTDEDMGWHVDDGPYQGDELGVLQRGLFVEDAPGTCIVDGKVRRIVANKGPLYRDGRIVGLIGYFFDVEEFEGRIGHVAGALMADAVTGAMSPFGVTISLSDYVDAYRNSGDNFGMMMVEVSEFDRLKTDSGDEVFAAALRKAVDVLREVCGENATIGRIGQSRLVVIERGEDAEDMRNQTDEIALKIHEIRVVDGVPCDPYANYAIAYGAEARSVEELITLVEDRLAENIAQNEGFQLFYGERISFGREKFDHMDERVYMADPDTYELVYVNKTALDDLGLPDDYDYSGMKCHKFISGLDEPCTHCSNTVISRDRFYSWTYHNPVTGKDYLLRDTLVPWRGKNYRWSMSVSLTDYAGQAQRENELVYLELNTNDALEIALREDDPDVGIDKMLQHVGETLEADRAYIFEEDEGGNSATNTYEWCGEGVIPEISTLQQLPMSAMDIFYAQFAKNEPLVIEDLEEYREGHEEAYENLKRQGISRLVAYELKMGDRSLGFIGVDNPNKAAFNKSSLMLKTLSTFVSILLRNRNNIRNLDEMGARDSLTGVLNRRSFEARMGEFTNKAEVAIVYCDLNGLKELNDQLGHEAGDELIIRAAKAMSSVVGRDQVFRMGGDEFVVLSRIDSRPEANELLDKLRAAFKMVDVSVAVGCVIVDTPVADIETILMQADKRMYANKEQMHEGRD